MELKYTSYDVFYYRYVFAHALRNKSLVNLTKIGVLFRGAHSNGSSFVYVEFAKK